MAQEIAETGAILTRQLAANASETRRVAALLRERDPRVIVTIARGSSDHASLYLKYLVEIELGIPCASIGPSIASLYQAPLRFEGALALTISQSGRSPDIVAMQAAARRAGALTLALVNDVESPVARGAESLLPLHAGLEKSVAATKSMIAALVAGAALVADWVGDDKLAEAIGKLPALLRAPAAQPSRSLIEIIAAARSAFVLGRGGTSAIAAEAALKLKETCAIHAEAFSSAEVLHGPAAIVTPGFLVIAFMPQDAAREGMVETLQQLARMGAQLVVVDVAPQPARSVLEHVPAKWNPVRRQGHASTVESTAFSVDMGSPSDPISTENAVVVPAADHPVLTPIVMIHRFHGLVEACAQALGRDPDNPPHLRKITETT
jgi:glucosamine--fructose-6-phosphate aminotransferase (isomerizing)